MNGTILQQVYGVGVQKHKLFSAPDIKYLVHVGKPAVVSNVSYIPVTIHDSGSPYCAPSRWLSFKFLQLHFNGTKQLCQQRSFHQIPRVDIPTKLAARIVESRNQHPPT
jgi:hypothetical protein